MIICIGRAFGSGGHEIGRILAESLSLSLFDQEIVTIAMRQCGGMNTSELEKVDEKKTNPWIHGAWYGNAENELQGRSINDVTFSLQSKVIIDAAKIGNCVFVGRCADNTLTLAHIPHLSLFITAPFECRVARKMEQLRLNEQEATTLVRKMDKQRKSYYEYYTGCSWGKPYNYDLCINSSTKGIEQTAETLAMIVAAFK